MSPINSARLKAFIAAVIWGVSFVATKAALREVQPTTIIVLRFGIGVLVLAFAVWRLRIFQFVSPRDLLWLALLGAIAIAIHQGLQATGLQFTSAGNMAWLVAITPIFTALLARLFIAETFGIARLLGLAIAFFGVLIVVTQGALNADSLRLPSTAGDLLALASALNWAIFSVASKPLLRRLPPTLMMAYIMFFGWLMTIPFFAASPAWNDVAHLIDCRLDGDCVSRRFLFRHRVHLLVRCVGDHRRHANGGVHLPRTLCHGDCRRADSGRSVYADLLARRLDDSHRRLFGESTANGARDGGGKCRRLDTRNRLCAMCAQR